MAVHIDPTATTVTVPGPDGPLPTAGGPLVRLTAPNGAEATVNPATGFNLFDWRVPREPGGPADLPLLYHEQDVLTGGSGTRSGVPVLFPFPNRIAGASFDWDGVTYDLPRAHPGDPNAIHGFCAKRPWPDVRASGPSEVTGTFRLSRDAADVVGNWPGDLELALTIALADDAVRLTATVTSRAQRPVPFGLGYHPYFTALGAEAVDGVEIQVPAGSFWELADSIPTGTVAPVAGTRDLQVAAPVGTRTLDDVLTDLPPFRPGPDGLMERAALRGPAAALSLRCDAAFRDMVVFTPSHRRAVAVEPYTCPTDAVHLQQLGRDVGWRTIDPGGTWTAVVEFVAQLPG